MLSLFSSAHCCACIFIWNCSDHLWQQPARFSHSLMFFSWDNSDFDSRPFRFALTVLRHSYLLSPSSSENSFKSFYILHFSIQVLCGCKSHRGKKSLGLSCAKNISCIACRNDEENGEKCLSFRNEHFRNFRECFERFKKFKKVISVAVL